MARQSTTSALEAVVRNGHNLSQAWLSNNKRWSVTNNRNVISPLGRSPRILIYHNPADYSMVTHWVEIKRRGGLQIRVIGDCEF